MSFRAHSRERGSIAIIAAICAAVAVIALGATDIGSVFFARRDMQRVADMAAIAGAQEINDQSANQQQAEVTGSCAQAPAAVAAATANATTNGFTANSAISDTITIQCGRWDTTNPTSSSFDGVSTNSYFSASGQTPLNAVQVTVQKQVPYFFFGPTRYVSATSTAKATDIDTFSVSATLATVNPTWLNALLGGLLGGNVDLVLANYQSLASANIKLGDLATSLGLGSVSNLVGASVTLSTLLGNLNTYIAALQAGGNSSAGYVAQLQAAASSLSAIATASNDATLGNTTISLANQTNSLLQLGLGNPDAGANATVDLLDLVTTAAEIAAYKQGHAVALSTSVTLPLGSTGFNAANLQLQILQPPSIASGEAGINPATGTWRTQASSAEIGLYLDVQTPSISISTSGLLNLLGLGGLLNISASLQGINLPLYLVVGGPAVANLASTSCGSSVTSSSATIIATPGIARLCLSQPPSGTLDLSNVSSCPSASGSLTLLNLQASASLLGLGLLNQSVPVSATISNPLLQVSGSTYSSAPYSGYTANTPYYFCAAPNNDPSPVSCGSSWASTGSTYWTTYSNNLGSELSTAVGNIGLQSVNILGIQVPVSGLTSVLSSAVLTPVLSSLDTIIVPLLSVLGVQVGEATVHQISLTCGVAQTVY